MPPCRRSMVRPSLIYRARLKIGQEGEGLKRGARVAVAKGDKAIVRFNDGCKYTLEDDEVLTIGDVSTCCASSEFKSYRVASQNPVLALTPARATWGIVRHAVANPLYSVPSVATTSSWWSWSWPAWSASWFIPVVAIATIAVPVVNAEANPDDDRSPLSP